MTDTVDVQAVTIGVGTVVAILALAYGTLISETLLGVATMTIAAVAFAATFAAVAVLHGAYGRSDMALAHGGAAVGWLLVVFASRALGVVAGLLVLAACGSYIAVVTIRARNEQSGDVSGT
ncbi:hypothetical protein [Natrialbaceae archaeon AArc-T1-2]|uniref:hypothetical protein n=1 Tax=Natrialbaceae archaeon AArc-T1-2 TaxID=3053904 RepID=UPI00255AC703|nr:hypothetical protein [Natrialbaceae archaeon AArc-T1-2]WIV67561.1 hypothetical protein QQ977_02190 [Natrialbaceae archaeon AArc-T1-2]